MTKLFATYLVTMQIVLEEVQYGGPDLTTNFGLVGQKYDLHSNYKANNFGVLHENSIGDQKPNQINQTSISYAEGHTNNI